MAFTITVQNDGVDGTVEATERVNLNERVQVFNAFMDANGTAVVNCQGAPPKDFTWVHHASNTAGGPESLDDGGLLRVNS